MGRLGPGELHTLRQRSLEPVQLGGGHQRPATESAKDLRGRDALGNLSVDRQTAGSRGGAVRRATGASAWTRSRVGFVEGETSKVPETMFTATVTSRSLVIDTISLRIMCGRCLTTSRIPTTGQAASQFHNNWPFRPFPAWDQSPSPVSPGGRGGRRSPVAGNTRHNPREVPSIRANQAPQHPRIAGDGRGAVAAAQPRPESRRSEFFPSEFFRSDFLVSFRSDFWVVFDSDFLVIMDSGGGGNASAG